MAKGNNDDGCVYVFGIPLRETAKCRADRKAAQLKKQEENANYKLAKQQGRIEKTDIRNAQQAATTVARANAGLTPGADVTAAIAGAVPSIAGAITAALDPFAALGGGLLGGSPSASAPVPSTGTDLAPIAIAAGVGVLLLVWSSK